MALIAFLGVMDLQAEKLPRSVEKDMARFFGDSPSMEKLDMEKFPFIADSLVKEGELIYRITGANGLSGYLLLTWASGRYEPFDYAIISAEPPEILSVRMVHYRSSHGAAVGSKSWLGQFRGYKGGRLELGKQVDHLSGATISATSMVEDVQRVYGLLTALSSL